MMKETAFGHASGFADVVNPRCGIASGTHDVQRRVQQLHLGLVRGLGHRSLHALSRLDHTDWLVRCQTARGTLPTANYIGGWTLVGVGETGGERGRPVWRGLC